MKSHNPLEGNIDCPICNRQLRSEPDPQSVYQVFFCFNPLANETRDHYYSHTISWTEPHALLMQEFNVYVEDKLITCSLNFTRQTTTLYQHQHIENMRSIRPSVLSFMLVPDFPDMAYIKRKIATAMVCS